MPQHQTTHLLWAAFLSVMRLIFLKDLTSNAGESRWLSLDNRISHIFCAIVNTSLCLAYSIVYDAQVLSQPKSSSPVITEISRKQSRRETQDVMPKRRRTNDSHGVCGCHAACGLAAFSPPIVGNVSFFPSHRFAICLLLAIPDHV